MKRFVVIAVLAGLMAPAHAQPVNPPSIIPQLKLPEQLNDTFRELMEDMKPALDETLNLMESFGTVGDPRNYHLPEVLPNGDIILRRKKDAPPIAPSDPQGTQDESAGVRT